MRKQFVRYFPRMLTLCLCGRIKYSMSNSPTQINQRRQFGAGLCVCLTNGRQGVCSGNLFDNDH